MREFDELVGYDSVIVRDVDGHIVMRGEMADPRDGREPGSVARRRSADCEPYPSRHAFRSQPSALRVLAPGGAPITFEAMCDWAVRAERLGFDSIWVSDHFFYSFARYGADPTPIAAVEPLTAIAGLATVTERIRMGTLVLGAPFRHPSILAKMATTIDAISGGRLELGVGAGWLERGIHRVRLSDTARSASASTRSRRSLQVLDALFSGGPATFDGPHRRRCAMRTFARRPRSRASPSGWAARGGHACCVSLPVTPTDGTPYGGGPPRRTANGPRLPARHVSGRTAIPSTFRFSVGLYSLLGETERSLPGGVRTRQSGHAGRRDARRDRGVVASRHPLGHAGAGDRADPRRSRPWAWRRSWSRRGSCRSRCPSRRWSTCSPSRSSHRSVTGDDGIHGRRLV